MIESISELFTLSYFFAVVAGMVVAGIINLTGVGGGVLVIPTLSVFFNLPPVTVVGTASLYVTFTKFISSATHIYHKQVDWRISTFFLIGAAPACLLAAGIVVYLLEALPDQVAIIQQVVKYSTVFFMIVACIAILQMKQKAQQGGKSHTLLLIPSGVFAGVVMALTGVGGGVLIIPLLSFFTAATMKTIVSCSLIIAFVISTLSGVVYSQSGLFEMPILISLLIGSLFGIRVSNFFRNQFSDEQLRLLVVFMIAFSSVLMLVF